MGKNSREFRLGGLSPCGKQDYPPVGNVFAFHSSVIFSHLTHVFLFVYYVSRRFSIYFFFSFLCRSLGFPSHPKTRGKKTTTKNPKSRPKSVETCLPNKCVCPPVCPTASKAQTFEPPLTIHFDVLFAQFFLVIKAAVLHMEFCFMTGLPQESRRFFVFAHSPAQ